MVLQVLGHRAPSLGMKRKRVLMLTVSPCACVLFSLCVVSLYECTCGLPMKCSFRSTELKESVSLAAVTFECTEQHLQSWAMIGSKQKIYHALVLPNMVENVEVTLVFVWGCTLYMCVSSIRCEAKIYRTQRQTDNEFGVLQAILTTR